MYSCISDHLEPTSQLCTHASQSIQDFQISSYVLMYLRAVRTYKSVVMYSCISKSPVSVLMYLRAVRTYKSVVMYSCISEQSELTSQLWYTHVSQSSHNLQVSSYVLMYLRAFKTYKSVVMYSCISEHSELTRQ